MKVHVDQEIGASFGDVRVEEVINPNSRTGRYFVATCTPKTAFGSAIEASPLTGIGKTQEIAVQRLSEARREFARFFFE